MVENLYYRIPKQKSRWFQILNIPTTPENLERFGTASRKGTKPQAQIGLGCLYDVLNRFIIESDINRVKFDEMKIAEQQVDRLPETIGVTRPFLLLWIEVIHPFHPFTNDG